MCVYPLFYILRVVNLGNQQARNFLARGPTNTYIERVKNMLTKIGEYADKK